MSNFSPAERLRAHRLPPDVPLAAYSPDPREEALAFCRGFALALALTIPLWIAVGAALYWLLCWALA